MMRRSMAANQVVLPREHKYAGMTDDTYAEALELAARES